MAVQLSEAEAELQRSNFPYGKRVRPMPDLRTFFNPNAVAVIGASKTPGKIGYAIVNNLLETGYPGTIYPINPKETEILGLPCYPSVAQVKQPIDMAVIAVPARLVVQAAEECGQAGVKFLVVITAGFKEVGPEGKERERQLLEVSRRYGMRVLGPNCVGAMDTHTPLDTSFAQGFPHQGNIAFISQSGAMVAAILDWSRSVGIGFSRFISLGNKADLDEADFIEISADDPNTKVILCYLEDVTNGERFLKVAREVSKKKPIVVLKSGVSQAGARAASSHTGALAGSDLAYDTAFKQCGVIRARSMSELFELGSAFASQPVPQGRRVVVVTNSGGPGIVATDAIEAKKLETAKLSKETLEALRQNLPAESAIYNPIDVLGDAKADRYQLALTQALKDPSVDSAIVLLCPTAVTDPVNTAQVVIEARKEFPDKPIFTAYMGGESLAEGEKILTDAGIPCYTFPETAVQAVAGMAAYAEARKRLEVEPVERPEGVDAKEIKALFYDVRRDRRVVLLGSEAAMLARIYGIPAAPIYLATTADEAQELAEKMGYPVVLKVASPKILHKTDVGGVKVGLKTPEEVHRGFEEIMESVHRLMPDSPVYGVEVQKMMPQGLELIIGMTRDVQFGPLMAFGLGGIYVNLLKDVSFRLANGLSRDEIQEMLKETKAYTLLRGYRGAKPYDINALVDVIARMARLALDYPEIAEMEINPIFAYEEGVSALDVKVTLSEL